MQTRHRIALLTAGLLLGAQIGIAQMENPIADTSGQMEPVPSEALAEGGTPGEPIEGQSQIAAVDVSTQTSIAAADEQSILPPAARWAPQSTAFPASGDELSLLPALAAYLDRTEHLRVTGASMGFPPSADELPMLPAVASFLDRRETTRLAAQAQPQVASDAPAADVSLAATSETVVATPN